MKPGWSLPPAASISANGPAVTLRPERLGMSGAAGDSATWAELAEPRR